MQDDKGKIVSVLLTFSTSLTIITNIPSTSTDHSSNNPSLSSAVVDKLQNLSKDRLLFAADLLHQNQNISSKDLYYNPKDNRNTNLARAVILYNDNATENPQKIRSILNYMRHGHNSKSLIFILNTMSVASPKHIFY